MNRRTFLKYAGLAAAAGGAGTLLWPFVRKPLPTLTDVPNFVIVIADDMRFDAMGWAGNPIIQTPALDAFSETAFSARNHFVTTSICPVSRASMFTGQHVRAHGIQGFGRALSSSQISLSYPGIMRSHGYHMGYIGKWGVGDIPKDLFQYNRAYAGQGSYYKDGRTKQGPHLTDRQETQSLDFFRTRPKNKPFCLVVATKAPHVPLMPQEQYAALYAGKPIPLPPTAKEQETLPDVLRKSLAAHEFRRLTKTGGYDEYVRKYYRLITGVDALFGTLLERLEKDKLTDSTCVIFTSDNGMMLGEHGLSGKWCLYEESIRVPMMIRLPERWFSAKPRALEQMTLNIDLAPTVLDISRLLSPPPMQGMSLLQAMLADEATRDRFYYEHTYRYNGAIPLCSGLRMKQWKYARYGQGESVLEQMFNLADDPREEKNLAADEIHASRLKSMREECRRQAGLSSETVKKTT